MKPKRHLERILNSMMKNLLLKINYRDIELDSEKQQTPQNSLQKQGLIHTKHTLVLFGCQENMEKEIKGEENC